MSLVNTNRSLIAFDTYYIHCEQTFQFVELNSMIVHTRRVSAIRSGSKNVGSISFEKHQLYWNLSIFFTNIQECPKKIQFPIIRQNEICFRDFMRRKIIHYMQHSIQKARVNDTNKFEEQLWWYTNFLLRKIKDPHSALYLSFFTLVLYVHRSSSYHRPDNKCKSYDVDRLGRFKLFRTR